jgi:hypothetical protein
MESLVERLRKRIEFLKTNPPESIDLSNYGERPSDRRAAKGDFQAGPNTLKDRQESANSISTRLEKDVKYEAMTTGGVTPEGKKKDWKIRTIPHHVVDIGTAKDVFSGNTVIENARMRNQFQEGGIYPGNQSANYTPVYDGALSGDPKHIEKTGIYSYDHKDIHTIMDENRKKLGWKKIKNVWHWQGIPVPQLPPELKTSLFAQVAFLDEQAVIDVQRTRSQVFGAVSRSEGDTYEQSKVRAMDNPESFASIDEQDRPVPDKVKDLVRGPTGKPSPKVSKILQAVRAMYSRVPVGSGEMDEDLMTRSEQLGFKTIEPYSIPRHLL